MGAARLWRGLALGALTRPWRPGPEDSPEDWPEAAAALERLARAGWRLRQASARNFTLLLPYAGGLAAARALVLPAPETRLRPAERDALTRALLVRFAPEAALPPPEDAMRDYALVLHAEAALLRRVIGPRDGAEL